MGTSEYAKAHPGDGSTALDPTDDGGGSAPSDLDGFRKAQSPTQAKSTTSSSKGGNSAFKTAQSPKQARS